MDTNDQNIETRLKGLPKTLESRFETTEDGKKVLYMGKITNIQLGNEDVRGKYQLTKYYLEESPKIFGLAVPFVNKRKAWSISSNDKFHLIMHESKEKHEAVVYNAPENLQSDFACRCALKYFASKKNIPLEQSLLDSVYKENENKILDSYSRISQKK